MPSVSARFFAARLRLTLALTRLVSAVDASDLLTVATLGLVGAGVALVATTGWALLIVGLLLSLLTPIGTALRIFVRGK